jgi:hypothetical protein
MKWFRRTPPPAIPPYQPPIRPRVKEEPSVIVEEEDTSAMTNTGVFKTWQRRAGRLKGD